MAIVRPDQSSGGGGSGGTGIVAYGTRTTNQTTVGTTYAAGADILAAAVSFTADGHSDYVIRASGVGFGASASVNGQLWLNFDAAQRGLMQSTFTAGQVMPVAASAVVFAPAAGAHTVNVRMVVSAAATGTIFAGNGTGTNFQPFLVTVEPL